MPTWLMHAVVPLQTMYSPTLKKLWMLADDHKYVDCAHGLVVRQPDALFVESVLKPWRVPDGTHVAEQTPPEQFGVLPPHAFPHAPQFALFESTSTHDPLQYSWPSGQQLPRLHHSEGPHAVVQVPQ